MIRKESLAYPIIEPDGEFYHAGLTKRELFAAMAMQGLCSDSDLTLQSTVNSAVILADLLIEELNK